jgi:diguanylate cyclase (GGDEF)-like protein
MEARSPHIGGASDTQLTREELLVTRIARFGGAAVTLVTLAAVAALVSRGDGNVITYVLYGIAAGIPFAYALFSTLVMRKMDLAVFSRYRSKVQEELTGLQELVYRDELTGLFNRRHFYEVARMEIEKARVTKQPLAIMLLDLDGLKVINDEYGHNVGDIVLANLGKSIATHTRQNDVPARLGGDEFGIVMSDTDKRGAFALARRLWADLEAVPMYQGPKGALNATVSIGLAGYPWGGETVEEMIQWADADMYANKVSRKLAREKGLSEANTIDDLDAVPDDVYGAM